MIPTRKGGKTYLRCTKCGFEENISESKEYVVTKMIDKNERVITTSVISEGSRSCLLYTSPSPRDRG